MLVGHGWLVVITLPRDSLCEGRHWEVMHLKWLQLRRYSKNLWTPPCLLDNIVSEIQRIVLNVCILSSSEFFLDSPFKVFDKLYLHIKIK